MLLLVEQSAVNCWYHRIADEYGLKKKTIYALNIVASWYDHRARFFVLRY